MSFAPEAGSEVRRTLSTVVDVEMTDMSVSQGGVEVPLPEGLEITFSYSEEVSVVDRFGAIEDDRMVGLNRKFETVSANNSTSSPEGELDVALASELEGASVVFNWDGDESAYSIAFAEEEEGDADLLEDLEFDMDAAFLLPREGVEEGSTWQLDPGYVQRITELAGDLNLEPEEEAEEDLVQELIEEASDNMDGEFEATFVGFTDEDGVRVAEISLAGEVSGEAEGSDTLETETPDGQTIEVESDANVVLTNDVEGTLLWNVEAGRMHSLVFSNDMSIQTSINQTVEAFGVESQQELTLEGNHELTVEVEGL